MIDEASTRAENSELLIALTRLALARAQGEDHAAAQALLMQARPVIAATLGENHSRMLGLTNECSPSASAAAIGRRRSRYRAAGA